jgi:hypothetical protein
MTGERKLCIDSQFKKKINKGVSHNLMIVFWLPYLEQIYPLAYPLFPISSGADLLFVFIHSAIYLFAKYLFQ